jgi:DNA-binding response OmpR family regulator
MEEATRPSVVLVVDDDRDIGDLVYALLSDEGFHVSLLHRMDTDALRVAVNQLEPACVLLDGASPGNYGQSWEEAAWLTARARRVPVIMFSAQVEAADEVDEAVSARVLAAGFAGVIRKPFDVDELVDTVHLAVGQGTAFDRSAKGESARTTTMVDRARELGALEVHASTRREWMNFRTADGTLVQLYYWQRDGVYYVLRHRPSGGITENLGRFYDLETALQLAITVRQDH